jgi:putative alpha-1,2-mannosidase
MGSSRFSRRVRISDLGLCMYVPSLHAFPLAHQRLTDDDYALSLLSTFLHRPSNASFFLSRSLTAPFTLFNPETGFMQARYANGSWAGWGEEGWTEGDEWCYSFDVVHDVPGLVERRGGKEKFVQSLEEHFEGGEWGC